MLIDLLLLPALTCLVLVLVHVYFGAFVLRRGILFIDLALAQWAALGYVVGQLLGVHEPLFLFGIGFSFTVIAACILVFLKPLYNATNLQEAVIGVVYIAGSALATGLLSSTGMEGHHLKEMLSGHLLFVHSSELLAASALYLVIAGCLYVGHQKFVQASSSRWEFIFYLLFGAVVTSSVKLVGILLVFSYLVLPILSVTLFTSTLKKQLLWGWCIGFVTSLMGLLLSIYIDIPPSYSVILTLCLTWLVFTGIAAYRLARSKDA